MLSRRQMMISTTSALGFSNWNWLQSAAAINVPTTKLKKRCVLIWLDGGPSQLDTLDPKPNAPDGNGGPLRPISTNVPGIHISETMPEIAKIMDKCAVIRSISTKEKSHNKARHHMHTGYLSKLTLDFPSIGAVVSYFHDDAESNSPRYVHLGGGDSGGCSSGFLGAKHSPLKVDNRIPYLRHRIRPLHYRQRMKLLREMESAQHKHDEALFRDHRQTLEKSLEFINSNYPLAFDQNQEPEYVRERYGETRIGRACLQARRLLEFGTSFVELNSVHWDMHSGIYSAKKSGIRHKTAVLDKAVSALVRDLESRGMLDDTLIVWMGEFGRTPWLDKDSSPGRHHFPTAWSTMLIGGGIPGGQVVGKTDVSGMTVTERPVSAADFLATIYHCLGLDHSQEIIGPGNRPLQLVDRQDSPTPIESLL